MSTLTQKLIAALAQMLANNALSRVEVVMGKNMVMGRNPASPIPVHPHGSRVARSVAWHPHLSRDCLGFAATQPKVFVMFSLT